MVLMNRAILTLALMGVSIGLSAQPAGDAREAFLQRSRDAASQWHARQAQGYGDFLRRSWSALEAFAPVADPFQRGDAGRPSGDDTSVPSTIGDVMTIPVQQTVVPGSGFPFRFYGRTYRVRYDLPSWTLPSVTESDVAAGWENLSVRASSLVEDCLAIRERQQLCDWAYLQLADSLSTAVFPTPCNERELLFGYLLGRAGYAVRFGNCAGGLTCLYGTRQIMYARRYYPEDGAYYYEHRPQAGGLYISEPFPGATQLLDLSLNHAPSFTDGPLVKRHIDVRGIAFDYSISSALLDFYGSYPHTEMYVKANAPVSEAQRTSLYPALRAAIEGQDQIEAANTILHFVQGLMTYESDRTHWGFEKWNFPEESLWYLRGDCDDHAILFARLIRDLLGLDVLLVQCEVNGGCAHAAAAVHFTEPLSGDTFEHGGKTWWCCEPTCGYSNVGRRCWEEYVVTRVDRIN